MARYQVTLAYDGTDFAGYQRQAKARTVQQEVERALRQLNWQGSSILSAGRTDTGVHASGQVIAFDLDWAHPPDELVRALNAHLPRDVAARSAVVAPDEFHPRFDALSRRYVYRIFCDALRNPLHERFAWRIWSAVDFSTLEQAARVFLGKHDFASFGAPLHAKGSTVRTVFSAWWRSEGPDLVFEVVADAFLYHMVRKMVFVQVEIGQGREPAETMQLYVERRLSARVAGLAPPQGLELVEVRYPARD